MTTMFAGNDGTSATTMLNTTPDFMAGIATHDQRAVESDLLKRKKYCIRKLCKFHHG